MIDKQDDLREKTRILKATKKINYKEIARDLLKMNKNSLYNWLSGSCVLSETKQQLLNDYINNILNEERKKER